MKWIIVLAIAVLIGCESTPKACQMDAKVCPDGSAVGRYGPNCEFAPCPDTKFSCETNDDCMATCREPGCYSKEYQMGEPDCLMAISHSCLCEEGVCSKVE